GKQLSDTAKKVSRSINRVRYIVEQVNAHIKTWKILKEDYRRPQGVGKVGSGAWLGDEFDGAFWLS
ncbi:MAG: hypothetical protein ACFN5T_13190, partial [Actinomyces sp.]